MNIATVILFIAFLIIGFVFFIRSRVIAALASGIRLGFILFFLLGLTALFVPQIFNTLGDFSLRQVGSYQKIVDLDNTIPINDIKDAPGNILDQLGQLFGNNNDDDNNDQKEKGYFEQNLYITMVETLGFIYRIFSLIIAFAGLIGMIYLSFITSHVTEIESLRHRVSQLEAKLNTPVVI